MAQQKLRGGKIYNICHEDIIIGRQYKGFVPLSKSIICSPSSDTIIDVEKNFLDVYCDFLITFDGELRFNDKVLNNSKNLRTSFGSECRLKEITEDDIKFIIKLFKEKGKEHKLANYLKATDYCYNRKLNKIIHK